MEEKKRAVKLSELLDGDGEAEEPLLSSQTEEAEKKTLCEGEGEQEKKGESEKRSPAFSRALKLLAKGLESSKTLKAKLIRRGFTEEEAEEAVLSAKEHGFINDKKLIVGYTEFLIRKKYYGPKKVKAEIFKKFENEDIIAFFPDAIADIDFTDYAIEFAKKRLKLYKSENITEKKKEIASALRWRGYTSKEVNVVLSLIRKKKRADN